MIYPREVPLDKKSADTRGSDNPESFVPGTHHSETIVDLAWNADGTCLAFVGKGPTGKDGAIYYIYK